jgi:hypothetical protein
MTIDKKPTLFSSGVGEKGMTTLHFAAYCGDLNSLQLAVQEGLDINGRDTYRGYSPLLWLADMAAGGGQRMETFDLLVQETGRI